MQTRDKERKTGDTKLTLTPWPTSSSTLQSMGFLMYRTGRSMLAGAMILWVLDVFLLVVRIPISRLATFSLWMSTVQRHGKGGGGERHDKCLIQELWDMEQGPLIELQPCHIVTKVGLIESCRGGFHHQARNPFTQLVHTSKNQLRYIIEAEWKP